MESSSDQTEQSDASCIDGYIRALSHGDTQIGLSQGLCVVDPIANHSHDLSPLLQIFYEIHFISRQLFSFIMADVKRLGHSPCRLGVVSGERYIFKQSEASYCFVSDQTLYEKVQQIKSDIPSLRETYCFEPMPNASSWEDLLRLGRDESLQEEVEQIKSSIQSDDVFTLIYTSGTTGIPKGVMLSHQNLLSNIRASSEKLANADIKRALSFLPCCHIFERMILYFLSISRNIDLFRRKLRDHREKRPRNPASHHDGCPPFAPKDLR